MTIRISLRGPPGQRTGTLRLGDEAHELARWRQAADGLVKAATDTGVDITITSAGDGTGTLSMAGRLWSLAGVARDGDVVTGRAVEVPADRWMEAAFGVGWDA